MRAVELSLLFSCAHLLLSLGYTFQLFVLHFLLLGKHLLAYNKLDLGNFHLHYLVLRAVVHLLFLPPLLFDVFFWLGRFSPGGHAYPVLPCREGLPRQFPCKFDRSRWDSVEVGTSALGDSTGVFLVVHLPYPRRQQVDVGPSFGSAGHLVDNVCRPANR